MTSEREEVVQAGLKVYERGLVTGTWGNISRRLEESPTKFAITPSGMNYKKIDKNDIVILNLDGERVEGKREQSTESTLHRLIYKTRDDTNAIVHTHSTFASSAASARVEIPAIVEDIAQIIGGGIKVAEYALPGTEELARSALKALEARKAALLANHGAVALGEDLDEALIVAEVVEKSAKIFVASKMVGEPQKFNKEEIERMKEMYSQYGQPESES